MKLEDIVKTYISESKKQVRALNGIDAFFEKGKLYAIMGESGSGKTTLINILGLIDNATRGKYFFDGVEVNKLKERELARVRNQKIGFVFQNYYLNDNLTALENVLLPTLINKDLNKDTAKNRAISLFEKFNLSERMNHYPGELSGGEAQRVSLIRALINDPTYILADEPTGNLDPKNTKLILKYLKEISKDKCVIVVTHNEDVKKYSDKILYLDKGVWSNEG